MACFRNFYRCAECNRTWTDEWSATCEDDCPYCGAQHMSPYKSEDVEATMVNKIAFLNDAVRRTFARGKVVMTNG